jgi:hypothetical protein
MSSSRHTRLTAIARFRDARRAMRERETEARRDAMLSLARDVTDFVIAAQAAMGQTAAARAASRTQLLADLREAERARADAARAALADWAAARAEAARERAEARRAEVARIVSEDFSARAA